MIDEAADAVASCVSPNQQGEGRSPPLSLMEVVQAPRQRFAKDYADGVLGEVPADQRRPHPLSVLFPSKRQPRPRVHLHRLLTSR